MALPLAAGAARLLWSMTRGALRQTKHLSPFIRRTGVSKAEKKLYKSTAANIVGKKKLRPWAQSIVGKTGLISKVGGGAKKTKKFRGIATQQYARGYKHLAKHKKLYGAGAGGAVIWDMMDDD